jgi:hypothetical protein
VIFLRREFRVECDAHRWPHHTLFITQLTYAIHHILLSSREVHGTARFQQRHRSNNQRELRLLTAIDRDWRRQAEQRENAIPATISLQP